MTGGFTVRPSGEERARLESYRISKGFRSYNEALMSLIPNAKPVESPQVERVGDDSPLNIRFTSEEREFIEKERIRLGLRSASDAVRRLIRSEIR